MQIRSTSPYSMRIKNTSNKGNIHNMNNIKNTALLFCMLLTSMMVQAQSNGNRLSVGVGALCEILKR